MNVLKITAPPVVVVTRKDGRETTEEFPSRYSGKRLGVAFLNGSGYTENELNAGQLAYLERKGYTIEGRDAAPKGKKSKGGSDAD